MMRLEETQTFFELQEQLGELDLNSEARIAVRCKLAKEFEDSGDYVEAAKALGGYWRGVGVRPELAGLEVGTAAEILLRVGSLASRFGKEEGTSGAQESATVLIRESLGIYEKLGEDSKAGECWTELGSCHWRRGDYEEARASLSTALVLLKEFRTETKAVALIRSALVENSAGRHHAGYNVLREAGELVAELNSHKVSGLYHNTLANVLLYLSHNEELAYTVLGERNEQSLADRALIEYAAAGFHFEQAGHVRFAARVLNNTGLLTFGAS